MSTITKEQIITWLTDCSQLYTENQLMLTELDAAIGDADHGLNMDRGFKDVALKLPTVADKDIGMIFKTTGMSLLSKVGGASGPLYGTFFIRAATKTMGKQELTLAEFTEALQAGVDGVVARGKAELNDKTMCDVWWDVIGAANKANESNLSVNEALTSMNEAANHAVERTIPLRAKKGRASYLGERCIGHKDPGSVSTMLMIETLSKVVSKG
ncbi:dihydroxyacetone kinase ADP-binding subunit DhaL [Vibrio sp. SS-MA-C1-2]|uniref:dihydroxyacetone kinase subunit DhaL n=1 Tax=Vibrio sp. SS-MA-C1-2 TaxID=2908646 RepID=UPI001F3FB91B|nr:dihydroxyacetone kinase subunit DhaL [Vibrio sp. SS-MA-C1-2]UJF18423.1 dihydroxyacetone kinase ADP-binding subunit DhaL [Vibrio sp. SS-MA-C1-2]